MQLPAPRISDRDYVLAYPFAILWSIAYAIFTPSLFTLSALALALSVLMLVTAAITAVAWYGVLTRQTLTIERSALVGLLTTLIVYGVLQTALGVYYIVTLQNTDRVALPLLVGFTAVLVNRRRRWLTEQRRQASVIAHAHEGSAR